MAMLFIMFDIEIVFLYPYAVSHGTLGAYGFWAIMVFSVVFFLSFVYEVAKGGLDWGPVNRARRLTAMVSPERTDAHHRAAGRASRAARRAERGDRGVSEPAEVYQASGATFADDGVAGLTTTS